MAPLLTRDKCCDNSNDNDMRQTKTLTANVDLTKILAYEAGELDQEEIITLFQSLVDSGLAWRLQGHYGRAAAALLQQGLIHKPRGKE